MTRMSSKTMSELRDLLRALGELCAQLPTALWRAMRPQPLEAPHEALEAFRSFEIEEEEPDGRYEAQVNEREVDVAPVNDIVQHTFGQDCLCGPDTIGFELPAGGMGWLYRHHALDGREHDEPDHDRSSCPVCVDRASRPDAQT